MASLTSLEHTISPSLAKQLENSEDKNELAFLNAEEVLKEGTLCKNPGCTASYKNEESNLEICEHHTGSPVFHEGMKFWSCCKKKTSDFSSFLAQGGCNQGKHLWIKKKDITLENNTNSARFDWFQVGSNVVVTIYTKQPFPAESEVTATPNLLKVRITFGQDKKIFEREFTLFSTVDLTRSSVTYTPTKTEITLRKADLIQWSALETS